jgi:hypothetical protein
MALTGAQLLDRVRRYVDDRVEPYLHTDADLFEFLTEAERDLAAHSRLLRQTMTFTTVTGNAWVDLPETPEVIEFRRAEIQDASRSYPLRLQGTMDTYQQTHTDYGQIIPVVTDSTGRPSTLVFGRDTSSFQLSPVPDAVYTITASVIVYPEEPITSSTDQVTIPVRHEAAVAIGAALRAIEADPFFDNSTNKLQTLNAAWQQALIRATREAGAISREAAPVQFSNDYW